MEHLQTLKDPARVAKVFRARVWAAVVAMILMTLLILARLAYLQIIKHDHFTTLSRENRLKIVPLPPTRGLIFSRDGVLLAHNTPAHSLEVVPERVADMDKAIAELRAILPLEDEHIERFREQLKRTRRFDSVSLKTGLTDSEVAIFSVNRHRFPGIRVVGRLHRHYPFGPQTAHLIGYVGRISKDELKHLDTSDYLGSNHIGKIGVEQAREDLLHGRVGFQQVEVNARGRVLRVVERTPPLPGNDLYLTIDLGLQQTAYQALGDRKGAIVAVEPASGAVLAFVSKPSFDPNEFVDGISRARFQQINAAANRPLFNRALQGQYPPGSTIKPMMAFGALEAGVRDRDHQIWCPGWFRLPGQTHKYRDWLKRGHGHVALKRSIAESCDVYYYGLAHAMGIKRVSATLFEFGFGKPTGIDLPSEASGLVPSAEWKRRTKQLPWYPGETLITGIGQGFMLASPLQLAYATSIVANRGLKLIPHVVGQVEDPVERSAVAVGIHERPPVPTKSAEHWSEVVAAMVEVMHGVRGTARRSAAGATYRYAGKTGTAQLFSIAQEETIDNDDVPQHLRDHALFIAFAPVDNPQIAVAIVVENGGSGSRTAAPIARRIFDYYLTTPEPGLESG
jgi:penicillin-binding protein 2